MTLRISDFFLANHPELQQIHHQIANILPDNHPDSWLFRHIEDPLPNDKNARGNLHYFLMPSNVHSPDHPFQEYVPIINARGTMFSGYQNHGLPRTFENIFHSMLFRAREEALHHLLVNNIIMQNPHKHLNFFNHLRQNIYPYISAHERQMVSNYPISLNNQYREARIALNKIYNDAHYSTNYVPLTNIANHSIEDALKYHYNTIGNANSGQPGVIEHILHPDLLEEHGIWDYLKNVPTLNEQYQTNNPKKMSLKKYSLDFNTYHKLKTLKNKK